RLGARDSQRGVGRCGCRARRHPFRISRTRQRHIGPADQPGGLRGHIVKSTVTQSLDKRLVSFTSPGSFAAEQYQGLRLTIDRLTKMHGPQVLAITSPAAGEGKTLTAINLAGALARESDGRVLLIDADLRRPAVATALGLSSTPGLTDLLAADGIDLS